MSTSNASFGLSDDQCVFFIRLGLSQLQLHEVLYEQRIENDDGKSLGHKVVLSLPLQADSEGPALIFSCSLMAHVQAKNPTFSCLQTYVPS